VDRQAVRAAVEAQQGLVISRLGWQGGNVGGGDVGGIGDDDVDAPTQRCRQRVAVR
jgi:hypothetical protein